MYGGDKQKNILRRVQKGPGCFPFCLGVGLQWFTFLKDPRAEPTDGLRSLRCLTGKASIRRAATGTRDVPVPGDVVTGGDVWRGCSRECLSKSSERW